MAINVLSLFDGMSCGQIALNKLGVKYDKYFASEIDKHAIKVTMSNYPNTIQLGSVVDVKAENLPKIDLMMGGSPCQSFSFAGKRKGMATKTNEEILTLEQYLEYKENGFEFEGQSYLFWEYVRLLNEVKPTYFLLENVLMEEKWERVISKTLGFNPVMINSCLLSAQNRKRLYWTNIGVEPQGLFGDLESIIKQPKDRGILLKDILESEVDEKYYLSDKMIDYFNRRKDNFNGGKVNVREEDEKAVTLTASYKNCDISDNFISDKNYSVAASRGRTNEEGKIEQELEQRNDGKTNSLTTVQKDNLIVENKRKIIQHDIPQVVCVRKYEVDVKGLQTLLKEHKKYTNQEIADIINVPKTMVEHWFRSDDGFSIPGKDIWLQLKELLEIKTDEFDKSIMEFEEREGTFEKSNRVYDENGIAPTLTSSSADEKILTRTVEIFGGDFRHDEGFRWRENGKSGTLSTKGATENSLSGIPLAKMVKEIVQLDEDILCISSKQTNATITTNKSSPMVASMGMGGGHIPMVVSKKDLNENQQAKLNMDIDTDKSNTLTLAHGRAGSSSEYMDSVSKVAKITSKIRRLTPVECERLQTVPDNYTSFVSDSQRYKMLGNGWTVDVIVYILNYLPEEIKTNI